MYVCMYEFMIVSIIEHHKVVNYIHNNRISSLSIEQPGVHKEYITEGVTITSLLCTVTYVANTFFQFSLLLII